MRRIYPSDVIRDEFSIIEPILLGDNFASKVQEILGATVDVAKRSELYKFKVIPKRWIVERSFGWRENIDVYRKIVSKN